MRVLGFQTRTAAKGITSRFTSRATGKYYVRNAWLDDKGKQLETPEGVVEEAGPYDVPMFQIIRTQRGQHCRP